MFTTIIFFCFLLGCVAGLRAFTAPAVVCWDAHLGWLHFTGTSFSFMDSMVTLVIFTLLALGELITDKLPKTPARTSPPQLIARILFGGFAGAALSVGAGGTLITGTLAGVVGCRDRSVCWLLHAPRSGHSGEAARLSRSGHGRSPRRRGRSFSRLSHLALP